MTLFSSLQKVIKRNWHRTLATKCKNILGPLFGVCLLLSGSVHGMTQKDSISHSLLSVLNLSIFWNRILEVTSYAVLAVSHLLFFFFIRWIGQWQCICHVCDENYIQILKQSYIYCMGLSFQIHSQIHVHIMFTM